MAASARLSMLAAMCRCPPWSQQYLHGRLPAILWLQQTKAVQQVQDHHITCHEASSVMRQIVDGLGLLSVLTSQCSVLSWTRCGVQWPHV